jgi:PKD repeat protein
MKKKDDLRVPKRDIYLKVLVPLIVLFCMVSTVHAAVLDVQFNGTPTSGTVPLLVAFHDDTSGGKSRLWDFGDESGSIMKNPTHAYLFAGTFNVSLTVLNNADEPFNLTKVDYITTTYPDIPLYFNSDPNQTPGSLVVNKFYAETDPATGKFLAEFTAFPTNLSDNEVNFCWDFDDGTTDTTGVPETTHAYGPGIFEPEVEVYNDGTHYTLKLPTYLIVVSPGTNIDDLIEEEAV